MHKNVQGTADLSYGAEQLLSIEPRINELAEIDVRFIANIDSTDMAKDVWEKRWKFLVLQIMDVDYAYKESGGKNHSSCSCHGPSPGSYKAVLRKQYERLMAKQEQTERALKLSGARLRAQQCTDADIARAELLEWKKEWEKVGTFGSALEYGEIVSVWSVRLLELTYPE